MFDPTIGRWLSEDPIEFGGGDANLHRYVGNSPVSRTDPSGLDWRDWVYPLVPGPALAIELLNGEAPTPQAVRAGALYAWIFTGAIGPAAARQFWLWVADKKMRAEGLPLSATFLEHSLGPATPYVVGATHFAYSAIRGNTDLQAAVDGVVAAAPVGASSGTIPMEFKEAANRDLYIALHAADLSYTLNKKSNDDYTLEATVQDVYNFERNISGIATQSLTVWAGANAAWLTQYTSVIQEFTVSAGPFTFSKPHGFVAAVVNGITAIANQFGPVK